MFKLEIMNMENVSIEDFQNACRNMANKFLAMAGDLPGVEPAPPRNIMPSAAPEIPGLVIQRTPQEVFGYGGPPPPIVPKVKIQEVKPDFTYLRTAAVASPEIDAVGQRWDRDIHTRTKSKTAEGLWKTKRGITVEAVDVADDQVDPYALPDGPITFEALMRRVTSAMASGIVNRAQIAEIVNAEGFVSIALIAEHPDVMQIVSDKFNAIIGVKS